MATVAAIDVLLQKLREGAINTMIPPREQFKGGTHDSGVNTRLLRQALQWKRYYAGRSFNRNGRSLSKSEEEGSEKDREGETELHCG